MLLMAASQYSLTSKTLEIYLGGCLGHCENCHNPELKNFVGDPLTQEIYQGVLTKIQADPDLIKNIWILGGEPLDSDHDELFDFLNQLNRDVTVPIWLWTRYELEQIPQKIVDCCTYIKTGPYLENLKTDNNIHYGIKLATSNQKIWRRPN